MTPRNACLDPLDSSAAHLVILGQRTGYGAPSGKPVVEEEYERAARPVPSMIEEQNAEELSCPHGQHKKGGRYTNDPLPGPTASPKSVQSETRLVLTVSIA